MARVLHRNVSMIEVLRTNDPVRLSWAQAVLEDAGIRAVVLDAYASAVEGSINAIQRRILVQEDDAHAAKTRLAAEDPDRA